MTTMSERPRTAEPLTDEERARWEVYAKGLLTVGNPAGAANIAAEGILRYEFALSAALSEREEATKQLENIERVVESAEAPIFGEGEGVMTLVDQVEWISDRRDEAEADLRSANSQLDAALNALGPTEERLSAALSENERLRKELAESEATVEALDAKVHSLSPHGICACSYDMPGDVCGHHSPKLAAASSRIASLEADRKALIDGKVYPIRNIAGDCIWMFGVRQGFATMDEALAAYRAQEKP